MKQGYPILWRGTMLFRQCLKAGLLLVVALSVSHLVLAQCPGGYSNAQLNWDKLDYYFNSTGNGPYVNYISDTREMNQKFAIGRTWASFVTTSSANINPGAGNSVENSTHTGDVSGFTGEDVQYNPFTNNQTYTITFGEELQNVNFTLYDVDGGARIDVDAFNAASAAQNVGVATYGSTILTINGNNNINTYITASATNAGNSSNDGTATFTIAGPVKSIVITTTLIGSDAVFWLSDINACVPGSFPTNYHQSAPDSRPFDGPVANQPQYILATPDNDGIYMVDPATGNAKYIFQDTERDYVNSFAYDPFNRILYYVAEESSVLASNKRLKKYDFTTGAISTVVNDISTLGIPTFNSGIESAGAAFYDGALYLGIEGGNYNPSGSSNDRTRESIIWRIEFDGSLNPVDAYQVYATNAYDPASPTTSIHDWGDFLIRDGVLINFNTARSGTCGTCYVQSKYHHYDLTTGQEVIYNNPGNRALAGQAGLSWDGQMYWLRDSVGKYNGDGTLDPTTKKRLVVVAGPNGIGPYATWYGGTGDASDPFRPKSDFGDAPASYDPDPNSPATHELIPNLRIGSNVADEWSRTASTLADVDADDNGVVGALPTLNFDANLNYSFNVQVLNNTGSVATLVAWLDYNFDGVFGPEEGVSVNVNSNASPQNIPLSWSNIWVPMTTNTHTFVRVRLTRQANGMTTANGMNGWFPDGEVEDFHIVLGTALPKDLNNFTANKKNSSVELKWTLDVQQTVKSFEILRSGDQTDWEVVGTVEGRVGNGRQQYEHIDQQPLDGKSYYRIKVNYAQNEANKLSTVRTVEFGKTIQAVRVLPNPAHSYAEVRVSAASAGHATIELFDPAGRKLFTQNSNVNAGLNRINIDNLGQYTPGIYTLQVKVDGKTSSVKFVINK